MKLNAFEIKQKIKEEMEYVKRASKIEKKYGVLSIEKARTLKIIDKLNNTLYNLNGGLL